MNLFTFLVDALALLGFAGHLYCLWTTRRMSAGPRRTAGRFGLLLGLLIVAANLVLLFVGDKPGGQRWSLDFLLFVAPVAVVVAVFAILLMRRSADLDVQSIGTAAIVVSLLSMASALALGSLTIAG